MSDKVRGLLDMMLEKGAEINMENKWGETPLHGAAAKGLIDTTKYLLEHDADVDAANTFGETALHKACRTGALPLVQTLVQFNANIRISGYCGMHVLPSPPQHSSLFFYFLGKYFSNFKTGSPLTVARSNKCQDIVEYLEIMLRGDTQQGYQVHQRRVNCGPAIDNIDIAVRIHSHTLFLSRTHTHFLFKRRC